MQIDDERILREVYVKFSPLPLTPEQIEYYVSLDNVRGEGDVVKRLADRIRLADGPVSQVLAGHHGSGKSTELMRLKNELESAPTKPYFVVSCKADDDIDRNDVDFPEILIAILRQLAEQILERKKISLKDTYLVDRFKRLGKLLGSEITFDKVTLNAVLSNISATIKNSPDARAEIRKVLEPDTSNMLNAANDIIDKATEALRKQGYAGLVIMLDDLDKMVIRPLDHAGCSTAEHLFVNRAAQLTAFRCHTIYTLPLSLAYSHHERVIKSVFGGHVPVVPMVKISTRPPSAKWHAPGVKKMTEMIEKRCLAAGVTISKLFVSASVRNELIHLSGGQPSELMAFVRDALLSEGLPISAVGVDRVRKEGKREYARILREQHYPLIEQARRTGTYIQGPDSETIFRELIDCRAILQYVNDDEWYGVNPLIPAHRTAKRKAKSRAKSKKTTRGHNARKAK